MPNRNKEDGRRYVAKYMASEKGRQMMQRQSERRRIFVDSAKNVPCADCGGRFPSCCMDFHHITGKKLFKVSDARGSRKTFAAIQREIDKCVALCANCHRIRHSGPSKV